MANRASRVDWLGEEVVLALERATDAMLAAIALRIEAQAKVNIVANGQVDTGFMLNSVYTVTRETSSYPQTWPSGHYAVRPDKHGGREALVAQERAPEADLPPDASALVAVGAAYAIGPELRQSFLYKAVEQVAGEEAQAEIRHIARQQRLVG